MTIDLLLKDLPLEALPQEAEQKLAIRLSGGTRTKRAAANTLVLHAMREAFFYARQCCRGQLPDQEIYSLAYAALSRATRRFRPKSIRFFSYAKVFVRGEICREWKAKDVVKKVSKEQMIPWNQAVITPEHGLVAGRHSPVFISEDERIAYRPPVIDGSGREAPTIDPDFSSIHSRDVWKQLRPLLEKNLTAQERAVIVMRYQRDLTFTEIGKSLKVSRQWAQTVHETAIERLRAKLTTLKRDAL